MNASREMMKMFSLLPQLRNPSAQPERARARRPVAQAQWLATKVPQEEPPRPDTDAQQWITADEGVRGPVSSPSLAHDEKPNGSSSSATPAFVGALDRWIDNELRMLAKVGEDIAPEDRLSVFQAASRQLVPCFAHFGPMLTRIFHEYEQYFAHVHHIARRSREVEGQLSSQLRAEQQACAALRVENESFKREAVERKAMIDKRLGVDTPQILAERADDLERRLRQERTNRAQLEEKLSKSSELSRQFNDALKSMELNFERMLADKNHECKVLRDEAAEVAAQASAEAERSAKQIARLEDDVVAADIELSAQRTKCTLLHERVRNLEGMVAVGAAKHVDLSEAYGILEARLEKLNKPTSTVLSRDPTMTPRPSRSEAVRKVPQLGGAQNYNSTASLIEALMELCTISQERAKESEKVEALSKTNAAEQLAAYRQVVHDKLHDVTTASVATMTESDV